jgi:hypothetical protein
MIRDEKPDSCFISKELQTLLDSDIPDIIDYACADIEVKRQTCRMNEKLRRFHAGERFTQTSITYMEDDSENAANEYYSAWGRILGNQHKELTIKLLQIINSEHRRIKLDIQQNERIIYMFLGKWH